jgi:hypothetical protein
MRVLGTISSCYLPGHQKEAGERLAPRPVNPVSAVARVYHHFPLRQVIVLSGMWAGLRGAAASIVYVYGIPNTRLCPPGSPCPVIPSYLLVRETVGHLVGRGLRITRARHDVDAHREHLDRGGPRPARAAGRPVAQPCPRATSPAATSSLMITRISMGR